MEDTVTTTADENVVAIMPSPEEVVDIKRDSIKTEITTITNQVKQMVITTQKEYEQAAEMGREIKRKAKAVKELFQPIKEAANKAHKAACEQERLMLDPLNAAEKAIKSGMNAYMMEQERKRRRLEEEARRQRELEEQRLLNEAIAKENAGNGVEADQTLEEALVMAEAPVAIAEAAPKVKGVSTRTDWEIESIDDALVPVSLQGVVIRPVDRTAIMRLVRASKGQISIPGVKITEVKNTVLRT